VFLPGSRHCLRADSEPWQYRWITLDGPEASLVVSSLGLDATPLPSGPCPDALFDELEQAVLAIAPEGETRATVPAYRLLVEAACARGRSTPAPHWSKWAESVRQHFAANLDDPEIGIAQIAEIVGLDRSVFTARFKEAAGVCPKEYQTALRLQRAMTLLRTTEASVEEVAGQCGFSCANYFIKAFAKRVGTTPHRYRRQAV
jgi:AraC-like DNA-binding protein